MFHDSYVEGSSFVVPKENKRQEHDSQCQTTVLETKEEETQTGLLKDFSCQAETIGSNEKPHYDVDKLASFLVKIYPDLIEELGKFDRTPQPLKQYDITHEDNIPVNLNTIELEDSQEKIVSSLSFSSDGKNLAVAFSLLNHESSCMHTSEVHIYKTNSDDYSVFPKKHVLKTNSCASHISFHPSFASYLACGLFNGQVFIWDLSPDVLEKSSDDVLTSDTKHSDAITSVSWLLNSELLVTSGRDGVIIFWNFSMKRLTTICCYFISAKYINPEKNAIDHAEILCIGMWKNKDPAQFIVGTEGGNILHCSSSKNERLKTSYKPGFFDPFVMKYEPHGGIITCVACSGKDVFATCGTNYEIRIYKSKEKFPHNVIYTNFPVLETEWFGGSSTTIACWGCGPNFYFNNVKTKDWLQSFSFKFKNPDSNITSVAISQTRSNVISIGTDKGEISLWLLPNPDVKNYFASLDVHSS